ncbi:MAG: S-layer homology domain-containing protein [Bacteroidia bacterium]|nr:S-layer homology domain-containing protein [Bacteroidia bacterium]
MILLWGSHSTGFAQVIYTGTPNSSPSNCNGGNLSMCGTYFLGSVIKAYVLPSTIVGNSVTVRFRKCDGQPFQTNGTLYIKANDPCGSVIVSQAITAGSSSYDITFTVNHLGTLTFQPTFTNSNNDKYYANTIAITGTAPDLIAINPNAPASALPGASIPVQCNVQNIGTVPAGSSSTGVYLSTNNNYSSTNDTYLGSISTASLNAGSTSGLLSTTVTIPGNTVAGSYYLFFVADYNLQRTESSESNNEIGTPIAITTPTPNLRFINCFNLATGNVPQGGTISGSFSLQNYGQQNWSGSLRLYLYNLTTSQWGTAIYTTSSSINVGATQTFNFTSNPVNHAVDNYRLLVVYFNGPNGPNYSCPDNNTCSPNMPIQGTTTHWKWINVVAPAPILTCGTPTASPATLINGLNGTLSYPITNTGLGSFTGVLQLVWYNTTTFTTLPLSGGYFNSTLAPGQTHVLTHISTPVTSPPGTYELRVVDANGNVLPGCTGTFTVISQPTTCTGCTAWTNPPLPGTDACIATGYLCQQGFIQNNQNGSLNHANAILRKELASITYCGLFGTCNPTNPAQNFPAPFGDMQSLSAQNSYWYNAAKTLCYLEYQNKKSAFDRNFINFRPGDPISRKYAIKAILEAFNIPPNLNTPNPYSDVSVTDSMYGYIKAANVLGIMNGNNINCASGVCFHPDDNMTREQAFVTIYRILTSTTINRPTTNQLQDPGNFFIPGNYTLANMGQLPGLDDANFSHYEKTSYAIAGRGLPLEFSHRYNSFWTELPESYFKPAGSTLQDQRFNPLGFGWTHSYNIYILKETGYTDVNLTVADKLYIFWPSGNIHTYNLTNSSYETEGVYDNFTSYTSGNSQMVEITTKDQIKYTFKSYNGGLVYLIQSISDRNNNKLVMYYQQTGGSQSPYRLYQVREEFGNNTTGRTLNFTYQSSTSLYLSSVVDNSISRTIYFNVNGDNNLASFTNALGNSTNYFYDLTSPDGTHLLTRIQLPKGNVIHNTYQQRKLTSTKTNTNMTTVNWGNDYGISQGQSHATITDAQNIQTLFNHNSNGSISSITAPSTSITNIQYGTNLNVFQPVGMNINGQSVTMNYDTRGNLLSATRNGISESFTYTPLNDVLTHADKNGKITNFGYSGGNLVSITDPLNGVTTVQRNSYGQVTQITNPSGIITNLGYDGNGNLNSMQMPLNISSSATYDPASRLVSKTDPNGFSTTFSYDDNDNLLSETDAYGNSTLNTYDPNDNLTNIRNAKLENTVFNYSFNEDYLISEAFGGNTKTYTYFPDGSLQTFTKATGTFTHSYDGSGRLISDGQTSYTYDSRSNIATVTNTNGTLNLFYDLNDRLDYYTDYFGNTIDYSYDNNGNVTSIVYPGGTKTVTYHYDAKSRMDWVKDWNNQTTTYQWLPDDRIDKVTYPNGTFCQYSYDAAGRMTGLTNKRSNNSVISEYTFTLDNVGNHLSENINDPATLAALSTVPNGTITYPAMPFNRIQQAGSTSFTHDGAGNIIQQGGDAYTFDLNDNLLSATGSSPATYTYDGGQNRRSRTANNTQVRYVLDILGMANVLAETDANNTPTAYYIYGATGLVSRILPNNTTHYYHYDFRGSTAAMTDAGTNITHSYAYSSFGEILAANEADYNPFRYNGQYGVQYDAPTRIFMRARYMDPTTGRFIAEDPVWDVNLYPYAGNNPINNSDPAGLWSTPIHNILIERTFRFWLKDSEISTLKAKSAQADNPWYQQEAYAYRHAMRRPWQSREKAQAEYENFLNSAKRDYACSKTKDVGKLGFAMHAIMDSTSPAHKGFKLWSVNMVILTGTGIYWYHRSRESSISPSQIKEASWKLMIYFSNAESLRAKVQSGMINCNCKSW